MGMVEGLMARARSVRAWAAGWMLPNENAGGGGKTSESGRRATPEDSVRYLYRQMWCDPDQRQAILDLRAMDREDGRVKRIHSRVARDIVRGGLLFTQSADDETLGELWEAFARRLQLDRAEKLKSDARGLVMEGSLPLQWVVDGDWNIVAAVRMPAETILPQVDRNGRFKDVSRAYVQFDPTEGKEIAAWPLWQLHLARFDPDNYDDMGSIGRPFLDATRTTWKKLRMTEEDLVIRRRTRAPLRMAHVLEGATTDDLDTYRQSVERDRSQITTDYYLNRKGSVSAVQGDANLDQIRDVVHLLDSFFAGSPLPKGLMGYTDGMARDILEDLKRDYYEEVDLLQDTLAGAYAAGFMLQCLLKGINPVDSDYTVGFAERRTETPSQTADRGLKLAAMGLPKGMVWEELGYDPQYVEKRRAWEAKHVDPYPEPAAIKPGGGPRVSVTPGNAPKGESATSITNG